MTIYTLAKKLNMTPSMVSRAFSPNGKISEEKRRIVLEAAETYGFQPNKMASRLSMKPLKIGVLICSRFSVNNDKMTDGLREAHENLKDYKTEYSVTILSAPADEEEVKNALLCYADCDGIILSGISSHRYAPIIRALYEKNPNIVQVQSVNRDAPSLFSSKHDEATAAGIAADFLSESLRHSSRKNILLWTGDQTSAVHKNASLAFASHCEKNGLHLLASIDMKDDEPYLQSILPEIFETYGGEIDGMYITSGISTPLCRFLEEKKLSLPFVAFDTYEDIKNYMKCGIVSAAISQDVQKQMEIAFSTLVRHLITGEECPPVLYTDVNLMLKSNMHQFG